jgi:hypothetical protein
VRDELPGSSSVCRMTCRASCSEVFAAAAGSSRSSTTTRRVPSAAVYPFAAPTTGSRVSVQPWAANHAVMVSAWLTPLRGSPCPYGPSCAPGRTPTPRA